MLVKLDPSATPYPDEPGRSPEQKRVCLRVEPWPDPVIDEVGHDPRSACLNAGSRLAGPAWNANVPGMPPADLPYKPRGLRLGSNGSAWGSGRDCLQPRSSHTLVIVPSQVPTFDCFISSELNQCVVTDFVSV